MKLALKRTPAPVSVDAVAAVIGTPADMLVMRFGEVGRDFMDRPLIAFKYARQAHAEWVAAQDRDITTRIQFEIHQEDRIRRRREVAATAAAAARATFDRPHLGGQEQEAYLNRGWVAERAALAEFDAAEPEITLSEFRERSTTT